MSLKHVILSILSIEDMTGYEITKEFDLVTGYFWSAPHQNVYRALPQLVQDGFLKFKTVTQQEKPDKKIYKITPSGLKELKAWFSTYTESPPVRDPLLVKFYAGEVAGMDVLSEQLRKGQAVHKQRLDLFLNIEREYYSMDIRDMPTSLRMMYLTLRFGIHKERSWLAWSKEAAAAIALS